MKKITLILLSVMVGQASAYTLTVTSEHGSVRVYPDQESYDSGTRVRLTPRPDVGYRFDQWTGGVSSKRLVLETTITADTSITANFKAWEVPMGIPAPSFGITQTYRMYDTAGNRNPALTYNASPDAGYYTHYVDSTHASATDTSNDYGSPSTPRLTVPLSLPPGSVVEIHNSASANGWGEFNATGEGTSAMGSVSSSSITPGLLLPPLLMWCM